MSELTVTLLRLGYLIVLWLFVLSAVGVLRRDLYGTKIVRRLRREPAAPAQGQQGAGPTTATPGEPAPARPAPARTGPTRLAVTSGPLRGTTLPLASSGILIGRAPACTLVLDDEYTSSRHARVFPQYGEWYVEDLGSTNGTFVDEMRIIEPTAVPPGVPVRVGQSTLELQR